MSKKKQAAEKEENAGVAADIKERLATLKEKFTAVENEKDAAKRIVDLLELDYTVRYIKYPVTDKADDLARKRAIPTAKSRFKKAGLVLASLPIITLPFTTIGVDWYSQKSKAQKRQELQEALDINGFEKTVDDYLRRTRNLLDDTVRNCDLREVIKSPYYSDALHSYEPLKKRFEAVAFARAAFGDEQPRQNAAAPGSAPAAKRGSPSYPELKL